VVSTLIEPIKADLGFWAAYHFYAIARYIKAGLARAGSSY